MAEEKNKKAVSSDIEASVSESNSRQKAIAKALSKAGFKKQLADKRSIAEKINFGGQFKKKD